MTYSFDPKHRKRSYKTYLQLILLVGGPFLLVALINYCTDNSNEVRSFVLIHWYDIIMTILAVAGFALSIIFYYKGQREKAPCVALRESRVDLEKDFPDVKTIHQVFYKGQEIDRATTTKIAFWNGGKALIEKEDIVRDINIAPKEGFRILSFQVKYISDETNNLNVTLKDGKIEIQFDYLAYGDGVVIKVLHTGKDENDFLVEGKVKGTKRILFPDTSTPPSNFLTKSDYYYHDYL